MGEINHETGLPYARWDGTLGGAGTSRGRHPSWRCAQSYCLNNGDYEAAELIMLRNLVSDECAGGACDDCDLPFCRCAHHTAPKFALEQPLKSLREVQSERDAELEDEDISAGLDLVEHQTRICLKCGHEERFSDNEGGTCEKIIDEESNFCSCFCSFATEQ